MLKHANSQKKRYERLVCVHTDSRETVVIAIIKWQFWIKKPQAPQVARIPNMMLLHVLSFIGAYIL